MKLTDPDKKEGFFSDEVSKKEQRKLKALRDKNGVWFGLGMMGLVGWSVAVPTLAGAAIGIWLDKSYPQNFSWTLSLLLAGLVTGIGIAGYWVHNEDEEIHKK
ncbi:AtpZ/AtpI family protein [Chryseobacterium gotjawalense]|uniref:AtpZ/AtpI family protein n=1 Tax=Chryseobacterium gotjawalense TaxID=3042315 RepID=A0ABY8RG04_9FLAO|nr:AtpZ/AtpI family protein [Chryseobacterium sp. wdc7]WHF52910.1 AtpZ/AtpI family protein [Chryseobacterium sp. wdc7]